MTKPITIKCLLSIVFIIISISSFGQGLMDIGEKPANDPSSQSLLRSKNTIMLGAGSTLLNGELSTPDFENFLTLQLKRFITHNIVIIGNIKKFDITDYGFKEEGFLSGDLNVEWYLMPNQKFTPFVFAGPGLLISNDFNDKNYKVQGGAGLEYLLNHNLAIVGSLEVNYIYDEQKGSLLLQEVNSLYYNATIGIQFYFGNRYNSTPGKSKIKLSKDQPSVIKSNSIGFN